MAKLSVLAGVTSQSVNIFVQDSSKTNGAGLTGLTYTSSGLIAYYTFSGANATSVSIALATVASVTAAYTSGGFIAIDGTNMPGLYRFDLPNAVLASGKGRVVTCMLSGATNMAPVLLEMELTGWDNQDAVHGGLSSLPNTPCSTNGSLITSGTGAAQITLSSGRVDVGSFLGTASVATAGYVGIDWSALTNKTATNNLSGTQISSAQVVTSVVNSVGSISGITFPANFSTLSIDSSGRVDLGKVLGTASAATSGYVAVDWSALTNKTATAALSNTTISTTQQVTFTNTVTVKKNTALSGFTFVMTDSTTHAPKTSLTVTAQRSIDGAAFAACANSATEVSSGVYVINLAASDLNGNNIMLMFTATGADQLNVLIVTQP